MSEDRIQKVLANAGVGSRRQVEAWIQEGRISVNGVKAVPGIKIAGKENITLDNRKLILKKNLVQSLTQRTQVLVYHKPEGEICSQKDPEGRTSVFSKLPKLKKGRWVQVGRLDLNTSGLLLFTNDGDLANKLMHPKYQIEREYAVRVCGEVKPEHIQQLKDGIKLEDGEAKFQTVSFKGGDGANRWYHVVLTEGRNRVVRRLWESLGFKVSRLMRVRFGKLLLSRSLRQGQHRFLTEQEIQKYLLLVSDAKNVTEN